MALRAVAYAIVGGLIGYAWWWSNMWQAEMAGPGAVKEVALTILFLPLFVIMGAGYVFVSKERHGPWVHVETVTMILGMFLVVPVGIPAAVTLISLFPRGMEIMAMPVIVLIGVKAVQTQLDPVNANTFQMLGFFFV